MGCTSTKADRAVSTRSNSVGVLRASSLENRFQLRCHTEKRQLPVYELSVDVKGSKVQTVKDGEAKAEVRVGAGLIQLTKATAATFASQLQYALGRPVIDKTSLSGELDFALKWTLNPVRMVDPPPRGFARGSH